MNSNYVKSSPVFFRLIIRAFWISAAVMLVLAWFIPAPLQQPADLAVVPNPVKSAWFLLWIQELVSYRIWLIYPVLLATLLFIMLPWLQRSSPERAVWFGRTQRSLSAVVLCGFLVMVALTIAGLFFRGENWAFVLPF